MASPSDLTTLAAVKAWQGIAVTDTDAQISALIGPASRAILTYLGRPSILPRPWSDRYDGQSIRRRVTLRNWPVVSVQSVQAGDLILSAVSPANPVIGYALQPDSWGGIPPGAPQAIDFYEGALWAAGRQGIAVTYTAGYQETDAATVPIAGGNVPASAPYGAWASDSGVTYAATGAPLVAVASAPAAGQYSVAAGVYTFAAADSSKGVLISYGFVPADLAQACVELVAQRMSAGARVGVKSKSLGGQETVSYDTSFLPEGTKGALQAYRRTLPI